MTGKLISRAESLDRWMLLLFCILLWTFEPTAEGGLIHKYILNNSAANYDGTSFIDQVDPTNGPRLIPHPAGSVSVDSYTFAANQGLTLSAALTNTAVYSILIDFYLDSVTGFKKILDFKEPDVDNGLYAATEGNLDFIGGDGPNHLTTNSPLDAGVYAELLVDRAANNAVTANVNGTQQISFFDPAPSNFTFDANVIEFFYDDPFRGGTEASSGAARRIEIYGPDIAAVPEPSTIALSLVGFGTFFAARRFRRK
jgi:hypothetical protein